jgi:hypothetical protein
MTDEWTKNLIDHINTDKSDDRFSNLREATVSQNGANRLAQRNNRIGIKGVRLSKTGKRFEVSIKMQSKAKFIGSFGSLDEAKAAYEASARNLFGEFARVA